MKFAILTIVLIHLAVAKSLKVENIKFKGSALVKADDNYGLAGPKLKEMNWRAFYVNDKVATVYTTTCQMMTKPVNLLTDSEKNLLKKIKDKLEQEGERQTYTIHHGTEEEKEKRIKEWEEEHPGEKPPRGFPDNLLQVGPANENTYNFIYHHGRVEMKPAECLSAKDVTILNNAQEDAEKYADQTNVHFANEFAKMETEKRKKNEDSRDEL